MISRIIITVLLFTGCISLMKAQDTSQIIFGSSVETYPEFPGGNSAITTFIQERLCYPENAWKAQIEETVMIHFYVEEDGTLSDFTIARAKTESLGLEAMRVIKQMPNWKPGTQREIPVRVKIAAPVRFRLDMNIPPCK